jgi:hypothetical protein
MRSLTRALPAEAEKASAEAGVLNPAIVVAGVICLGLPFVAFARLVLFHFYLQGSFVLDTGLLASLMWHSDWALTLPQSVGVGSFFATHISPLFLLLSGVSRILPISMTQFFAGFIGLSHMALAVPVFWLLVVRFRLRRGVGPWTAAGLAVGFAFSGLALAIARYPHFETLIAAFFLLFAVAQTTGRKGLAVVFFVLGLATREDAGLHYAAVLGLLVTLNAALGVKWRRQWFELVFLLFALLYSASAFIFQAYVMAGVSAFLRVYLGDPPLAHVTFTFLTNRIWLSCRFAPVHFVTRAGCGHLGIPST